MTSILENVAKKLGQEKIDISHVVSFMQYLDKESEAIQEPDYNVLNADMLERLMPLLDMTSKQALLSKIIEGQSDWRLVKQLLPYIDYMTRQLEAAVVDGALPKDVANMITEYENMKVVDAAALEAAKQSV